MKKINKPMSEFNKAITKATNQQKFKDAKAGNFDRVEASITKPLKSGKPGRSVSDNIHKKANEGTIKRVLKDLKKGV